MGRKRLIRLLKLLGLVLDVMVTGLHQSRMECVQENALEREINKSLKETVSNFRSESISLEPALGLALVERRKLKTSPLETDVKIPHSSGTHKIAESLHGLINARLILSTSAVRPAGFVFFQPKCRVSYRIRLLLQSVGSCRVYDTSILFTPPRNQGRKLSALKEIP